MIDQASVFAERFKGNPQVLQATVLGQGNIPGLDPYTALNALRLIKESNAMQMAAQAQQPTSSPSIVAENMAPPPMQQGLGAMVPNTMGQAPQGQAPQQAPQAPAMQASGGLAGMPISEENYAAGGIVAFADGDLVGNGEGDFERDDGGLYILRSELDGSGNPAPSALTSANERLQKYVDFVPKEMSEKQQEEFLDRYIARINTAGGQNIYTPAREELKARREALAGDRRSGEGMALLTAAGAVLKGRNLAEGASNALPAYANAMSEVRRSEQQEKRSIEQMNFALADAERKERMGDARGAQVALAEARKFQQDANRSEGDKLRYGADIAARTVQYIRPPKDSAGASPKLAEQLGMAELAYATNPTKETRANVVALRRAVAATKSSTSFSQSDIPSGGARDVNAQANLNAKLNKDVADKLSVWEGGTEARLAKLAGNLDQVRANKRKALREEALRGVFNNEAPSVDAPATNKKVIKLD